MNRGRLKLRLKIAGRATDIENLARAVTPDPATVTERLKALVGTFGDEATALLLDVSLSSVHRWTARGEPIGPTCRRVIWTLYGMVYAPHELATLFDYATYGRFTSPPEGDPSKPPRQRDSKGKYITEPPKQ